MDDTHTHTRPPTPPESAKTHLGVGCARECAKSIDPPAANEIYTITIRAMPSNTPAAIRLRQLLKLALRAFSLRCISVTEITGDKTAGGMSASTTTNLNQNAVEGVPSGASTDSTNPKPENRAGVHCHG